MKYQLITGGLRIIKNLVRDCLDDENIDDGKNVMEQLPLPVMRNNDQRKEWLRNYKAWGLWYTDEHIGVRYYKYDFAMVQDLLQKNMIGTLFIASGYQIIQNHITCI